MDSAIRLRRTTIQERGGPLYGENTLSAPCVVKLTQDRRRALCSEGHRYVYFCNRWFLSARAILLTACMSRSACHLQPEANEETESVPDLIRMAGYWHSS